MCVCLCELLMFLPFSLLFLVSVLPVYTFFRDYNVTVQSGIVTPPAVASSFVNPLGVYLSGKGIMDHVINDNGATTGWNANRLAYVCT